MSRFADHRNSSKILKEIETEPANFLIIHYSCESFYDTNGKSPRITTIAVKFFNSGQRKLFAIHQIAERHQIEPEEISEHYEYLEKQLLDEFYQFVENHLNNKWVHWNMRDSNFGFEAIEQRYRVLGGKPIIIPDNNKVDLSRLFLKRYGKKYIDDPRIKCLMEKNNVNPLNFLDGKKEAEAFKNKKYIELSMSSSAKVEVFSTFLDLAINNKLIVNSKKSEIYGNPLIGWYSILQEKSWGTVILWIFNIVIGTIIGAIITKIFF